MRGYWMKPQFTRPHSGGGNLIFGPLQINWYGNGWRVYLTWPGRTRTLIAR